MQFCNFKQNYLEKVELLENKNYVVILAKTNSIRKIYKEISLKDISNKNLGTFILAKMKNTVLKSKYAVVFRLSSQLYMFLNNIKLGFN